MMWLLSGIYPLLSAFIRPVRKAFSTLLGIVTNWPWQTAVVAALALSWWLYHGKQDALDERDAALAQNAQILAASKEAERLAIAAREATERRYRDIANAIDKEHEAALADARDATDAYIVRMRTKATSCPSGSAVAASQGGGAGLPEITTTSTVLVEESDVRICGDLYTYANAAHDWASGLNP